MDCVEKLWQIEIRHRLKQIKDFKILYAKLMRMYVTPEEYR